jgi:hypothetical protein
MKLLDQLASGCAPVLVNMAGGPLQIAGASGLADVLAAAPIRYLLGEDIRDACRAIAGGWAEGRAAPSRSLSVPAGAMWLEWSEADEAGHPRRTAVLVRAEGNGRRGTIHACWEDASLGAELAIAHICFDLDQREPAEEEDDPELCLVEPYATLVFEPDWAEYFSRAGTPRYVRAAALRRCAAQVMPHFAMTIGFAQLLAARRDIAEKRIDRQALNRTRLRKGRPTLLDHVELSLGGSAGTIVAMPPRHRPAHAPIARSRPDPSGLSHARI